MPHRESLAERQRRALQHRPGKDFLAATIVGFSRQPLEFSLQSRPDGLRELLDLLAREAPAKPAGLPDIPSHLLTFADCAQRTEWLRERALERPGIETRALEAARSCEMKLLIPELLISTKRRHEARRSDPLGEGRSPKGCDRTVFLEMNGRDLAMAGPCREIARIYHILHAPVDDLFDAFLEISKCDEAVHGEISRCREEVIEGCEGRDGLLALDLFAKIDAVTSVATDIVDLWRSMLIRPVALLARSGELDMPPLSDRGRTSSLERRLSRAASCHAPKPH
ncbi:MAG: hypothetical protein SOU51_05655 [Collinsella sp.]|nr:hypothetical protein [Collinsella sp.]